MLNPENYPKPQIRIHGEDYELEISPENTTLFRFVGKQAIYDHLLYSDETCDIFLYAFLNGLSEEQRDTLMLSLIANGYPCVINQDRPAECDIKAFDTNVIKPMMRDLEDEEVVETEVEKWRRLFKNESEEQ